MKILALETSSRVGSIAVYDSESYVAAVDLPESMRTAESLVIGIQELIEQCGWNVADLELIAVTQGPGSFTGLRLGCVTAKVLAYAINAQLVGVNTLKVIASSVEPGAPLWCVMDAGRDQCFVARYAMETQRLDETIPCAIMSIEDWLDRLEKNDRVAGPLLEKISPRLPREVTPLANEYWRPRASAVAQLGRQKNKQGQSDDLWDFSPHYYRLSAAEEQQTSAARQRQAAE